MTMITKADRLFKIARATAIAGVLIAAYSFIDGSFWRGFGENEFVILVIFCFIFDASVLYVEGYLLCMKLPHIEETAEEPEWFGKLFRAAFSPLVLIVLFGLFNGATELLTLFSEGDFWPNVLIGILAAAMIALFTPLIPAANLIIILYFYRKNKRKKYIGSRTNI